MAEQQEIPPLQSPLFNLPDLVADRTSLLSDETLLHILSKLPKSQQKSNTLVSKWWLNLQGRLVQSVKPLDWDTLISGRLFLRSQTSYTLIWFTGVSNRRKLRYHVNPQTSFLQFGPKCCFPKWVLSDDQILSSDEIDSEFSVLASRYPNLRKINVINATEMGLLNVAKNGST